MATTSRTATAAGKALGDPKTPANTKKVAASVLSKTPKSKAGKAK